MPKARVPMQRAVPFTLNRAQDNNGGLNLYGYAAVFNEVATCSDMWGWIVLGVDEYDEQFAPTVFDKSLSEGLPYLMYQHGRHPLFGNLPIGAYSSLTPDSKGLAVDAQLHDNWLVEPVRDAIRSGSVSGMSIMYQPLIWTREERAGMNPLITHTEGKLIEAGPVVMPVYESTEVGVRAMRSMGDLRSLRTLIDRGTETTATLQTAGTSTVENAGDPSTTEAATPAETPQSVLDLQARHFSRQRARPTRA